MTHRPIRDSLHFFGKFLRDPQTVGAVLPSSRFLARALVGDLADLEPGDLLVEYGPGTGSMTATIAERLPEGVEFLGIEIDTNFCRKLRARFPKLPIREGSVADVEGILHQENRGRPRRIISGLPFASLPLDVQRGIVDGTKAVLLPGGEFRTFQYVHAYRMKAAEQFRAAMDEKFDSFERSAPILRNVPPAYVLSYRQPLVS